MKQPDPHHAHQPYQQKAGRFSQDDEQFFAHLNELEMDDLIFKDGKDAFDDQPQDEGGKQG